MRIKSAFSAWRKISGAAASVCLEVFGPDHIIWSNDYPYRTDAAMPSTKDWINCIEVPYEDREKIAHLNAEKLLNL